MQEMFLTGSEETGPEDALVSALHFRARGRPHTLESVRDAFVAFWDAKLASKRRREAEEILMEAARVSLLEQESAFWKQQERETAGRLRESVGHLAKAAEHNQRTIDKLQTEEARQTARELLAKLQTELDKLDRQQRQFEQEATDPDETLEWSQDGYDVRRSTAAAEGMLTDGEEDYSVQIITKAPEHPR